LEAERVWNNLEGKRKGRKSQGLRPKGKGGTLVQRARELLRQLRRNLRRKKAKKIGWSRRKDD
jgi:hypothetical protein